MPTSQHVFALCAVAALAVCTASGAAPSVSRPLTASCRFEAPDLQTVVAGVTRVTVAGCARRIIPGQPILPFRTLRLLLPPGFTATGVVARATSPTVNLPGVWQLELGREPTASARAPAPQPVTPAPVVPVVPLAPAELVSVQRLAGYDLAVIRVFPVAYAVASHHLMFTSEVSIEVNLGPEPVPTYGAAAGRILPSQQAGERQRVAAAVDNPEALAACGPGPAGALADPSPHYLLVTRAALLPAFHPLLDQKAAAGLTVHTETIETILASFSGVDSPERLRNYIRYAYNEWSLSYVLLGGDIATVPYRGAYARCSGETLTAMPSDLYFACLDGSWNRDGDSVWGEPTDGETGGEVDVLAEVCVGRAPVDTAAEVTNFVTKSLSAAQAAFRARFAAEYLDSSGAQGGNALDALWPAFDTSHVPVAWLDDRPLLAPVWTAADAVAALNLAPLLVAHFGHTDEATLMRITPSHLSLLTNPTPFLLYSTGCDAGAFDNGPWSDCIAEQMIVRNRHGAFAVVANAREGWYDRNEETRYSGEFQARFFERLLADQATPIGVAHQSAKQDLLGSLESSGDMPYRWCLFGITLFGDPHTSIRVPLSLRFRVTPAGRVVTWNSWTNRTYSVYRATEPGADIGVCLASNVVATPPVNRYTDAALAPPRAFYRVRAE